MVSNRFTQSCNKLITIPRRRDINIRTTISILHIFNIALHTEYFVYNFTEYFSIIISQHRLLSEAPNPERTHNATQRPPQTGVSTNHHYKTWIVSNPRGGLDK